MKRITTTFVLAALFLSASPAFAQSYYRVKATTSASTTPVKARVQTEVEVRKASSTQRRVEFQTDIAKRRADNTLRVLKATIGRLRNIADRIESRITKVEASGGVATESRTALAEARNHLSLAETSIAAFASVDLSGSDVRTKYDRVKAIAAEAKGHIREAHRALMRAVSALKPGFRTNNATSTKATSTATTTNQ